MNRDIDQFIEFCVGISEGQGRRNFFNMADLVNVAEKVLEVYENENGANHQGHIKQSFFVIYDFFSEHQLYLDPNKFLGIPFNVDLTSSIEFIDDMKIFLEDDSNNCEEYDVVRFRQNIPSVLGGNAVDGGRWSPQYKIVIPLVKAYMSN